jgi:glycosyltransferase involved in cell wall biosynthesis
MRTLLWLHPSTVKNAGGSAVQWRRTAEHLGRLGVDVTTSTELEPEVAGYEIVHLMGLQFAEQLLPVAEKARAAGCKLALSTTWWDFTESKFVTRGRSKARWRLLEKAFGAARARALYSARRRQKHQRRRVFPDMRRLLDLADVVLPNSLTERDKLSEYFRLEGLSEKSGIVPNASFFLEEGIATPPSLPPGTLPGELRGFVLQVGHVYPLKNQLGLLAALRDDDLPIVFVGRALDRGYLRQLREGAARRGRVWILGALPQEQLGALYRRASVHVLPSFAETTGLAGLEAASFGCPTVMTDRGCTREYFGDSAYYCDPTRRASIRKAVLKALEERRTMPRTELYRFTWRRAAEATRQSYEWLVDPERSLPDSLPPARTG